MTLKIDRARAQIRLSGKLRSEHLDQIKAEIELCESPAVLDLEELELIDVEAVRFLNTCEEKGVSVLHCSPYIRKWMLREQSHSQKRAQLLDEFRKSYQALSFEERKRVTAFLSELSGRAMKSLGEQRDTHSAGGLLEK